MTTDDLKLSKQVCFALYTASRAATQVYRPMLDALGLTYPQYLVMLVLWEQAPITVKELGAELDLDSGTLSPVLKRLESAGLLTRARQRTDERSVVAHLTDEGTQLRHKAEHLPRTIAAATGLDTAELEQLRDRLMLIADTLNETHLTPDEEDTR